MTLSKILRLAVVAAAVLGASAHVKRTPREMVEYHKQVARDSEALAQCLDTPDLKELNARIIVERRESFHRLRKARGIDVDVQPRADKPALEKWHKVNHEKTADVKGKDFKNDASLFGFDPKAANVNPSVCVLAPESIWGPYFQDREAYRQDIRENQKGVYQRLALQVIDITTCKPLQGARVDVWQANAQGQYAKEVRVYTKERPDVHWLTGAQATSPWGTVDFDTIFPGHYAGRAVHTHLSVRPKGKFNNPDGFVHTGQLYYDEYPRQEIDRFDPYASNTQELVLNLDDGFAPDAASEKYDSFVQWAWLDGGNHQGMSLTGLHLIIY
ncbi:uncharacterized protein N0V89_001955 [Didymosphaeria variabile]|uniref:Intradiol ring-cleavage dioxygenases domain-containing protein n=1 Tax=Didymosphaeria variabile TaxID=1932322 RepID=A0A9W9CDY1_9PLEO|nr:uncharacterized protein N0V89_001955 [Didymosphaeria variabile]KAJ4357380.1 hypothetical protein N0V89_001955 [Didymosphaeria variabile]